jgi:hypothetical protein
MTIYNKRELKSQIIILTPRDIILDDSINKEEFIHMEQKKLNRNIV